MIAPLLALLIAVQSTVSSAPVPPPELVQSAIDPPQPEQVMAVPAELQLLVDERMPGRTGSRKARLDSLMSLMFDKDGLSMEYAPDATYTVAEAFRTRKANCLTFTLMTIALAREVGLTAYPQEIERTLSWDASGDGVFVQSTHVNAGVLVDGRRFTIDVATDQLLITSEPRQIDDRRLQSLYYNNRAMELMLQGNSYAADRWLKASLSLDAGNASPWNNAGVLALRNGAIRNAEQDFLRALELNPGHSGALSNIVSYYQRHGDRRKAETWRKRAEHVASHDPLHQFLLGWNAEQRGDLGEALTRYRRAARLDNQEPMFQLTLARVWLLNGDHEQARRALQSADQLDIGESSRRYQAKIRKLRQLVAH